MVMTKKGAQIVIRGINPELVRRVKVGAAEAGETVTDWVLRVLAAEVGCPDGFPVRLEDVNKASAYGGRDGKQGGFVEKAKTGQVKNGRASISPRDALARAGGSAGGRSPDDVPGGTAEAHDPKVCRVHRCGRCAVAGVKDAMRGLK